MNSPSVRLSLALFSSSIFAFALMLVTGYALSFLGLTPSPALVFVLVLLEFTALAVWLVRQHISISAEPLELAGFLLVVGGAWLYFIAPSWPTLFPASYSSDAAVHYAYIIRNFSTGDLIPEYPGGPTLIAATLAHWIGWLPLRVMHLLGAFWIALTAGGIYGTACSLLPPGGWSKIVALFAPFALFIPWDYFAGILIGAQYFWVQVAAQLFIVAVVRFLAEHLRAPHAVWSLGTGMCLVGISVSFPLWLALPTALIGWVTLVHRRRPGAWRSILLTLGPLALFWAISFLTGGKFVPALARFGNPSIAIIAPSLRLLGGAYLILPALGLLLSWRRGGPAQVAAAFMLLTMLQSLCLEIAHLAFGVGYYWVEKSFFIWVFPLALLAAFPIAAAAEWAFRSRRLPGPALAAGFVAAVLVLSAAVFVFYPPNYTSPMNEAEIQVALWAKAHLDTQQINYVSRQGLVPQWLGTGFWGEVYPDDLSFGLAQLGPKTFEEWRDDPSWGKYLYVTSSQHFSLGPGLQTIHRSGDSMIVEKTAADPLADAIPAPTARFGSTLALIDYELPDQSWRAGQVISFTARVQTQNIPPHQVVWRLQLRDLDHNAAAEARIQPFGNKFPLQRWPDGKVLPQSFQLTLPIDLRAGLYNLELGLYYTGSGAPVAGRLPDGTTDDVVSLGQIKVELPRATTHELGAVSRLGLKVGDAISLLGYRLPVGSPLRPGQALRVDLYWQSVAAPPGDYTAFVHLLDSSGVLRAQSDSAPRRGTYPTSIWTTGEIVLDSRVLVVPQDAPPGDYQIEVGMYEWPGLKRLPVLDAEGRVQGDHIVLPRAVQVVGK